MTSPTGPRDARMRVVPAADPLAELARLRRPTGPWLHLLDGAPSDARQLGWMLGQDGMAVRILRGHCVRTGYGLFDEAAAALQLPGDPVEDWSALAALLTDMGWLPGEGHLLTVTRAALLLAAAPLAELHGFVAAIREVARGRAEEGDPVPFHVVFQDDSVGLAVLRARLDAVQARYDELSGWDAEEPSAASAPGARSVYAGGDPRPDDVDRAVAIALSRSDAVVELRRGWEEFRGLSTDPVRVYAPVLADAARADAARADAARADAARADAARTAAAAVIAAAAATLGAACVVVPLPRDDGLRDQRQHAVAAAARVVWPDPVALAAAATAIEPPTATSPTPDPVDPAVPDPVDPTVPGLVGPAVPDLAGPAVPGLAGPAVPGLAGPAVPGLVGPAVPDSVDPTTPDLATPDPAVPDLVDPAAPDPGTAVPVSGGPSVTVPATSPPADVPTHSAANRGTAVAAGRSTVDDPGDRPDASFELVAANLEWTFASGSERPDAVDQALVRGAGGSPRSVAVFRSWVRDPDDGWVRVIMVYLGSGSIGDVETERSRVIETLERAQAKRCCVEIVGRSDVGDVHRWLEERSVALFRAGQPAGPAMAAEGGARGAGPDAATGTGRSHTVHPGPPAPGLSELEPQLTLPADARFFPGPGRDYEPSARLGGWAADRAGVVGVVTAWTEVDDRRLLVVGVVVDADADLDAIRTEAGSVVGSGLPCVVEPFAPSAGMTPLHLRLYRTSTRVWTRHVERAAAGRVALDTAYRNRVSGVETVIDPGTPLTNEELPNGFTIVGIDINAKLERGPEQPDEADLAVAGWVREQEHALAVLRAGIRGDRETYIPVYTVLVDADADQDAIRRGVAGVVAGAGADRGAVEVFCPFQQLSAFHVHLYGDSLALWKTDRRRPAPAADPTAP